jgi:transposase
MMGRLNHDQEQFFYSFRLDEAVPNDHPVREVAAVLDLSWVHSELAPYYPRLGRPSIDPVLMIRMLIIGYVFAIRSERALCRDVRVNLAYRWFCGLSIEDKIPDHSMFSRARNERFRDSGIFRSVFERVVGACIGAGLVGGGIETQLIGNWTGKVEYTLCQSRERVRLVAADGTICQRRDRRYDDDSGPHCPRRGELQIRRPDLPA